MNSYQLHQQLIRKFKLDAQEVIKGIRIFDRHVGLFYRKNGDPIKINHAGMADCYALLGIHGTIMLHMEFEFKTGKARQSKSQKVWQRFIESNSGIYMVIREDYHDDLEKLKKRVEKLKKIIQTLSKTGEF